MPTTYRIRIEIIDGPADLAAFDQSVNDPKAFSALLRGYADHADGIAETPSPTKAIAERRLSHGRKPKGAT